MNWLENFNESLDYIEEKLDGEINHKELAKLTGTSEFHYSRMFSCIIGIPLCQYVRNRKMTLAAFDLQTTEIKIIDLAMKYGYESPTAFNRAFKSVHDIAPSKAKKLNTRLTAFPPMQLTMQIKGDVKMNYSIVKKEAFRVVGVRKHFQLNLEENFKEIPKFWKKTAIRGIIPKIMKYNTGEPKALLGISTCMNGKDFDYYIATPNIDDEPKRMEPYMVPACTWAIFESFGPLPEALQSLQKRILTEWLPTSGYEYTDAPDIEAYSEGNQRAKDYRCEVWIPIKKK